MSPDDLCQCGDKRSDHADGFGPCAFNRPGFDMCHANEQCLSFRLASHAPTPPEGRP